MNTMKKQLMALLFVAFASYESTAQAAKIKLESPAISILDGKSWAISGPQILEMISMRKDFKAIMTAMSAAQQADMTLVIDEVIEKSRPFLHRARGFKEHVIELIAEGLIKMERPDSILGAWATLSDSDEALETFFRKSAGTMGDMKIFLEDVIRFLELLVDSCPKAKKQFITIAKRDKAKSFVDTIFAEQAVQDVIKGRDAQKLKSSVIEQIQIGDHEIADLEIRDITLDVVRAFVLNIVE